MVDSKRLFFIFNIFYCIPLIICHGPCNVVFHYGKADEFNCIGLTSLNEHLSEAPVNTTRINVVDSEIPTVIRYSFVRFSTTLESLNLRKCGITEIDVYGFTGLIMLKRLVLWENKLKWISAEWFISLTNLRHLDISFNEIFGIDNRFYQMLPNLENFYFDYNQLVTVDYNMFPLLYKLKTVKFGYNPWDWRYRILLTRQLDDMRVDYRDDWEEWGWMISVAQECQDSGYDLTVNNTLLDCAVGKFLNLEIAFGQSISNEKSTTMTTATSCLYEAISLMRCPIQMTTSHDSTRKVFESLIALLSVMGEASGNLDDHNFV